MYNYLVISELNENQKTILDKINCKIIRIENFKEYVKVEDITKECFKLLNQKKDTVGKSYFKTLISNDFEKVKAWDHPLFCKDITNLNDTLNFNLNFSGFKLDRCYDMFNTLKNSSILAYNNFNSFKCSE